MEEGEVILLYITRTNSRSWKKCKLEAKNFEKLMNEKKLYMVLDHEYNRMNINTFERLIDYCNYCIRCKNMNTDKCIGCRHAKEGE